MLDLISVDEWTIKSINFLLFWTKIKAYLVRIAVELTWRLLQQIRICGKLH